uniref:DNA-directed RNA polymerase subunit beta n=2 Tax=Microthamnion kuetzingianum TaxID=34148 RepID=A0A097KNG7_9CHLO|nr:beta subunit of RNA polymerase [Microthamnion kuetzingianum]AIT94717.1 beta subunit of RNA polymerase [Microthamnion kuetzingianum]
MQFQRHILSFFNFDFVETQRNSFSTFLEHGIIREFLKRNSITDSMQGLELIFYPKNYKLTSPKITPKQALLSSKTYESQLYIPAHFIDKQNKKIKLQWVLLGNLPLMTKRGHFIINGSPRVIVHQMVRSPGIYFQEKIVGIKVKNTVYYADLIPFRGAWIRLDIDKKGHFWVRMKKTPKIPLVIFLQALGLNLYQILHSLEYSDRLEKYLKGDYHLNGECYLEGYSEPIRAKNVNQALDIISSIVYPKKPSSSVTQEMGHKFLFRRFMNPRTYDLAEVGRVRLNIKLGINIGLYHHTLTAQDFLGATNLLIKLALGLVSQDDIDDLKNRRVRTSGELLQNQLGTGLARLEKVIRERMKKPKHSLTLRGLITTKAVNGAFREFFGASPLSQYMDQTNPLSEITHKRRLSSLGPGGITRETAGMAVRGIHPTHYGRICPIETPEGQNAGLVNSMTTYSRINSYGFLETPLFSVFQGQVQNNHGLSFFSSEQEKKVKVAPADLRLSYSKFLPKNSIPIRDDQEFQRVHNNKVEFIAISSVQMISVATALIPFLEHDDANRALMGSNMQRQAVSLMIPERPLVVTGLEARVIADSGQVLQARKSGFISYSSGKEIYLESISNRLPFMQREKAYKIQRKQNDDKLFLFLPDGFGHLKKRLLPFNKYAIQIRDKNRIGPLNKRLPSLVFNSSFAFNRSEARQRRFFQKDFLPGFFHQLLCRRQKLLHLRSLKTKFLFFSNKEKRQQFRYCWLEKYKQLSAKKGQVLPNKHDKTRNVGLLESVNSLNREDRFDTPINIILQPKYKFKNWVLNNLLSGSLDKKKFQNTAWPAPCINSVNTDEAGAKANFAKKTDTPLFFLPGLKKKNYKKSIFETAKYTLQNYERSNQDTCLKQRPSVSEGNWVQKGDILADCSSSVGGELSLGKNILVAYMPWDGYNFEDAILISERLVADEVYTSIHIERYETEVRETKFGLEQITSRLPEIKPWQMAHLDTNGIAKLGSFVKHGDLLVGKVTPIKKRTLSPHEKLLYDIVGKAIPNTRDTSLRVPKGVKGRVVHTKIIESDTISTPKERSFVSNGIQEKKKNQAVQSFRIQPNIRLSDRNQSKSLSFLLRSDANQLKKIRNEFFLSSYSYYKKPIPTGWYHPSHKSSLLRDKKKISVDFSIRPKKVYIFLAEKRHIQRGDKLAGRHGNKGIVSQILPRQDMPFLPDGTPIDMVLNPLGVPSRMNVGQIFESLLGLAGQFLGEQYKIAPFDEAYGPESSRALVYSKLYEASLKTGQSWLFNPEFPGKTKLFDGRTGICFDQPVTVGKAYMLKLVHLVDEKIHARSTGPYSLLTQQPLRGRSKQGGQRLGEMEVWALEGFGAAYTLQELLTIKSDDTRGRHQLMDAFLDKKSLSWNASESFKVLLRELQSVCLNVGLYALGWHETAPGQQISRKQMDIMEPMHNN